MPLLSIIVATYNRCELLAEALESVRSQEFDDYELIVVDDGSTDGTSAQLARYAQEEWARKLRILSQANAGQGAARNLAIAEARGEYCTFLDSDDLSLPWSLQTIAQAIENNVRPSVLIGQELGFHSAAELHAALSQPRQQLQVRNWPDLYAYTAAHHLGPCGILVARTDLLREVGGFLIERMVGEDIDLMLRLGVAPNMLRIEAPWTFGYRIHPGMFTSDHQAWYRGACRLLHRYRNGIFPGGRARDKEVRKVVALTVAYYGIVCLRRRGGWRSAGGVYLRAFNLHLRAGNYRYLIRTPFALALGLMRRPRDS